MSLLKPRGQLRSSSESSVQCVDFGSFRLFISERRLVKEGMPVPLGSRALDILTLLVEKAGNVVTKQELIAHVWPDLTVEESNLRVHIAYLRKGLGDGHGEARYVANIAGRGYCFVGQITRRELPPDASSAQQQQAEAAFGPPRRLARMIGREDDVQAISDLLAAQRFVTIHGAGGIGKTTVALAVADDCFNVFKDGIPFFDLGLRKPSDSVPEMLASTLGLMVQSGDPSSSIINYLRDRQMLLIFDSCEHVIDSAAVLAEAIVREVPHISILATSREPLRVEGEHLYPLPSLGIPPEGASVSADQLVNFPAARLFLERAVAGGYRDALNDANAPIVADICRKVDGIPLALELAAGRISTHGLQGTAILLDNRLKLLWQGRRTALPRHQTLNAMLDWSYELISEPERVVLRRLSVFVGPFTLDEAQAVAADDGIDGAEVVEALAQLVSKSFVFADISEKRARYRLLDTTRAYAQAKLAESGEEAAFARRHALYYQEQLERAEEGSLADPQDADAPGAELLGNTRVALEWSFSAAGDTALGVELAASAVQLFIDRALLRECRVWAERALSTLGAHKQLARCEMVLRTALGHSLMYMKGQSAVALASLERAQEIAELLDDRPFQLRLLGGLHMYHRRLRHLDRLLPIAHRAAAIAAELADPAASAAANAMLGTAHHLVGNFADARTALTASLRQPSNSYEVANHGFGVQRDQRILLARNLWLQGFPDQAIAMAHEADLVKQQDPVSDCLVLLLGVSLFRWAGDWATVENYVDRLMRLATDHSLEPYKYAGVGIQGDLLIHRGEVKSGLELMRNALGTLRAGGYEFHTPWLSCSLATGLVVFGHLDQALAYMDEGIAAVRSDSGLYSLPDMLRVRGDLLVMAGDEHGAESCFQQSLAIADEQTALSWRLRTVTSFAQLRSRQGRRDEARSILAETYARFTEGFETSDLRMARLLLDELDRPVA